MFEFIATYWWVWLIMFFASVVFVGYSHYKARQRKDFIVTGSVVGCLVVFFQCIGAFSAILTILGAILKLVAWKVTNG